VKSLSSRIEVMAIESPARVSTRTTWPDGALGFLGDVLVLSAEGGLPTRSSPDSVAASADPRVHALLSVPIETEDGSRKWALPH
jgi:hypothetical protein